MNQNNTVRYFLLFLAMLFWGSSFVLIKIVYRDFSPLSMVFFRLIIASLLMSLFWLQKKHRERIPRKDIKLFLLLAFCEPFCYFLGEAFGLLYVSSSQASIIISTIPIFAVLTASIFFKERFLKRNWAGIFLSLGGIVIMTGYRVFLEPASLKGLSLMFFAVFSAVGYSLVVRQLTGRYSTVTIITMQNIIGSFLFLPLFLNWELHKVASTSFHLVPVLSLVILAVFCSVISFFIYTSAIRDLGVGKATAFTNIIPVITAVFAWFILDEHLTTSTVLGMITVITGLFLSQIKKKYNTGD